MSLIFLVFHLIVAACLVGLVLMQRSEGGALGMGGGGGSALISGRGAADFLARLTMGAGVLFFITSLTLTWLARGEDRAASVVDAQDVEQSESGILAPQPSGPVAPSADQAVQRAGPLGQGEEAVAPEAEPAPTARTPAPAPERLEPALSPLLQPQPQPSETPAAPVEAPTPAAPGGPEE